MKRFTPTNLDNQNHTAGYPYKVDAERMMVTVIVKGTRGTVKKTMNIADIKPVKPVRL